MIMAVAPREGVFQELPALVGPQAVSQWGPGGALGHGFPPGLPGSSCLSPGDRSGVPLVVSGLELTSGGFRVLGAQGSQVLPVEDSGL